MEKPSATSIFQLITCDGKADRMLMEQMRQDEQKKKEKEKTNKNQ